MTSNNKSCIDVILPTLGKNLDFLHESIDSVINQAETNKVLICIDKESRYKSELVTSLNNYSPDKLTIIYSEKQGVGETLNAGLRASSAPYIARQDDDDISEKFRFAKQLKLLQDHKSQICFSALTLFENDDVDNLYTEIAHEAAENYFWIESLVMGSTLNHATLLSENFYKDENIFYSATAAEDYHLWLRIAKNKKIYTTNERLYRYRQHELQKTKNWVWTEIYAEIFPQWEQFCDEINLPRKIDKKNTFNLIFNPNENYPTSTIQDFLALVEYLVKNLMESKQKGDERYWDYLIMRVSEIISKRENTQKVLDYLKSRPEEDKEYLFNVLMLASIQLGNLKNKHNSLGELSHKIRLDNQKLLQDNIKLNKKFTSRAINKVKRFFES
jgi:glycosyltransferase involved in cell wall biosynthesis